MKNEIQINLGTDHALECTEKIIGRSGEGLVSTLAITVPATLTDFDAYIDFEKPNGEVLRTPKLEVENGVAYYDVEPYLLFESGEIKVQLVFIKGKTTWKSSKKKYTILKSINAIEEIPDKEDFISQAQAVLDELSGEVQEIADMLADNADFAQSVIDACGGQTKITTINGKPLKFFVDTQEEYDKLSEAQKQNLFAIITDDKAKEAIYKTLGEIQQGLTETNDAIALNDIKIDLLAQSTLKVLDYPVMNDEGTGIIFPFGTLLTLEVDLNLANSRSLKMFDIITGLVCSQTAPQVLYLADLYTGGNDIMQVAGEWKVCGKCGENTITGDLITRKTEYYLIQQTSDISMKE